MGLCYETLHMWRRLALSLLLILSLSWGQAVGARNLARSPRQVASWTPGAVSPTVITANEPPADIQAQYPWLAGQATVEMKFTHSDPFIVTLYGDHAPVTAGNFLDLVAAGHYQNIPINVDRGFLVRVIAPDYIDPVTGAVRYVPVEVQPETSATIHYGYTFRQDFRDTDIPVLKNAYRGSVALAHPEGDANHGSAQLLVSYGNGQLIPFTGNELDGTYAVFGYIDADFINYANPSADVLSQIEPDDQLEYVRVISGLENLHRPTHLAKAE